MKKYKSLTAPPLGLTVGQQRQINSMTNWQNSQWMRDGCKPDRTEHYSNLKRGS